MQEILKSSEKYPDNSGYESARTNTAPPELYIPAGNAPLSPATPAKVRPGVLGGTASGRWIAETITAQLQSLPIFFLNNHNITRSYPVRASSWIEKAEHRGAGGQSI
jgi:hypothetical protein